MIADYDIKETVIEQGGVFRCCLATVATEYLGERVAIGAKSKCPKCGESFTLRNRIGKPPLWQPDWHKDAQ